MKNLPSVSIITCTLNANLSLFEEVLTRIASQEYPKKKIEHIVMDAGSTNGTIELAKKYGCEVIVRPDLKQEEQVRASLGIKNAKNKLILILESDNFVIGKDWLLDMLQPFIDNKSIVCSFIAYNTYKKNIPPTPKYCTLIWSNDPTIYYLHKTEKIPLTKKRYDIGKVIEENSTYYTVTFTKNTLPTIGDNGHMFLRSAINKVNTDPNAYVHVDAFMNLLLLGYNTYGVVKNRSE